ncbi:MAG: DUF2314 domain-containing protein [Terriglobales bacterium]
MRTTYEPGDYVKIIFESKDATPGEAMWMIVDACDSGRRVVFGRLDNQPIATDGVRLGQQLAVSFDKIVEHRKPTEFSIQ